MAVYKDKRNGTWYFKGRYQGKFNTRRGFRTKKEALLAEEGIKGNVVVSYTIDVIAKEYIQSLSIRENTSAYSVESVYNNHICEQFGKKRIERVTISDIRDLQNSMISKLKDNGEHYSNQTINKVTRLFNSIMNYAVKFGYISKNPCSNFKTLKEVKTKDELKFWTDEQFMKAIYHETDIEWYCYLVLSYLTGMRKGEVRALKWTDIDFDKDIIQINHHVNDKVHKNGNKKNHIIKGRKNGDTHIIAMDNNIISILKLLKEHDMKYDGWNEDTYLFGIFKPVGQYTPNRHLNALAIKEGLPIITIHGLRHSHVSYLISKGLSPYEIADRIGDTVEMVLKVYGHLFPNPQKNIVRVLNESFNFSGHERENVGQNVGQNQLGYEKKPFNKGSNNNMAESMRYEFKLIYLNNCYKMRLTNR